MLVVGSFGLSAPAYADTTCNFDVTTATLTLDRDAAVSIGHAGDDFVFGGVDQLGNCGAANLNNTALVVVNGTDADDESVILDMTAGPFDGTGLSGPVNFELDLGVPRTYAVVVQGVPDRTSSRSTPPRRRPPSTEVSST